MLEGKFCLVTGASSGIGLATASALAAAGAELLIVGRDRERTEAARALVSSSAASAGAPPARFELADFSSMKEVASLAGRIAASHARLDVLVNCAGAFTSRRTPTAEGLETQFAVNHLAPFLLTTSLLGLLEGSDDGRVVTVSSGSHYSGKIRWKDPQHERFYFGLAAYEQSKLANVLFSYELARRLGAGSQITVFADDPGLVNTEMGQKQGLSPSALFWSLRRRGGTSPEIPAAAIRALVSEARFKGRTGLYWRDAVPIPSSRRSYSEADAKRLWALSERLIARALGREADFPSLGSPS